MINCFRLKSLQDSRLMVKPSWKNFYFNATFDSSIDQGITVKTNEGAVRAGVPLESASPTVRDKIQATVFSRPRDFRPSGGY